VHNLRQPVSQLPGLLYAEHDGTGRICRTCALSDADGLRTRLRAYAQNLRLKAKTLDACARYELEFETAVVVAPDAADTTGVPTVH
jgi:hypothetical protein